MALRKNVIRVPETEAVPLRDGQNPFFKVDHVAGGDVLTLTGWTRRTSGRYGPQIVLEVTQDATGRTFDFGIGEGSPNHRVLFKVFKNDDPKTWRGELRVSVKSNTSTNQSFVSIDSAEADVVPF